MTEYTLHDELPKKGRGRAREYFPDDLLDLLRENPGKWACAHEGCKNTAQASYWRKVLAPNFDISTRRAEGGGYDYWIRFVG